MTTVSTVIQHCVTASSSLKTFMSTESMIRKGRFFGSHQGKADGKLNVISRGLGVCGISDFLVILRKCSVLMDCWPSRFLHGYPALLKSFTH